MKMQIGSYALNLPRSASVSADVDIPPTDVVGEGGLHLVALLGRYRFSFHISPREEPKYLADFILSCSKQRVTLEPVVVNGIHGVTHGGYNTQRTWIDWWLKKGDSMLCINLQTEITVAGAPAPSDDELEAHRQVINSVRYIPDEIDK
jgi:hypothetical protein